MDVPDIASYNLMDATSSYDFGLIESVLVQDWKFDRLTKSIKELKKEVDSGVQLGLFG